MGSDVSETRRGDQVRAIVSHPVIGIANDVEIGRASRWRGAHQPEFRKGRGPPMAATRLSSELAIRACQAQLGCASGSATGTLRVTIPNR